MAHQGYYTNPSNLENINDAMVQVDADADRAEAAANTALVSETNAATSASDAANNASSASASAANAALSATNAANSAASSAANSAASSTNAANAASSATNAAISATASANSASEAAASAASINPANLLAKANNLSDVQSVSSARTNLGVYSTAQVDALKANKTGDTFTGNVNIPSLNDGQLAGMRNKIINGKMEIAQRGISFPAVGTYDYTVDRFRVGHGTAAVMTVSQSSDVPGTNEFQRSMRMEVTTADASIAAGDYSTLLQRIEGYSARDLVGRTFTLSFWVRSAKTGVHCICLQNSGYDRSLILEYTVNVPNTWEYKSVVANGGLITAGTWGWTTEVGLNVSFTLASGTTFRTTAGSWKTGNFLATANQVNCLDTVGNIFAITGVQLEVGSVATPFEHRPYGVELALCQRYTCIVENGGGGQPICNVGFTSSTTVAYGAFRFPTRMRAAPTFSILGGNASSFSVLGGGGGDIPLTALTVDQVGVDGCRIVATSGTALTQGYASVLRATTYPIAVFSAEL